MNAVIMLAILSSNLYRKYIHLNTGVTTHTWNDQLIVFRTFRISRIYTREQCN